MSLLDQDTQKKQQSKGKKIVLMLLILCIFLLIMILIIMVAIGGNQQQQLSLTINNNAITVDDSLIISDQNGINYISMEKIATQTGYQYLRGGYLEYIEDNSKCYLEKENQIIQFEADSNIIYKTNPNFHTDYEQYELKNNIIQSNNTLYISLDDLNVGLNVVYSYSEQDNRITISTVEQLTTDYLTSIPTNTQYTAVSEEPNNEKAISYNMIVVSTENNRWGVIDRNFATVISNKYSSMEFIEAYQTFIVSDENRYGVISSNGDAVIDLNYDEIQVINYYPLLYKVKQNNKYGVIDENGQTVVNIEYSNIGYESTETGIDSVTIIENINNNGDSGIVVSKDNKYGIVNLSDGSVISDCVLDKIYSRTGNDGNKTYYIELQETEVDLNRYIEYLNTSRVDIGQ